MSDTGRETSYRAIVFAGGERPTPDALAPVVGADPDGGRLVIAADSGLDHALALGFRVDLVVGDLDSASADAQATARAAGAEFETHPVAQALADLDLDALVGRARITVVRTRATLHGPSGSLCSLIPVGGPARGVRTDGLRYPLDGEDLQPGSTRGISNELLDTTATVTVADGVLLAVQPDALATEEV